MLALRAPGHHSGLLTTFEPTTNLANVRFFARGWLNLDVDFLYTFGTWIVLDVIVN